MEPGGLRAPLQAGHHPAGARRAVHEAYFVESHAFHSGMRIFRAGRVAGDLHGHRHLWCRPQSDRCVPAALAGPSDLWPVSLAIKPVSLKASLTKAGPAAAFDVALERREHASCSPHRVRWPRCLCGGLEPNRICAIGDRPERPPLDQFLSSVVRARCR
jgi:hypothetical protein